MRAAQLCAYLGFASDSITQHVGCQSLAVPKVLILRYIKCTSICAPSGVTQQGKLRTSRILNVLFLKSRYSPKFCEFRRKCRPFGIPRAFVTSLYIALMHEDGSYVKNGS